MNMKFFSKAPGDKVHNVQFLALNLIPRSISATFFETPVHDLHSNYAILQAEFLHLSMRNLIIDGAAGGETKRRHDVTFPLLTLHRGKDRVHFSTGFFQ
jgi:hypothetical protein